MTLTWTCIRPLFVLLATSYIASAVAKPLTYEHDIRPILALRCAGCHRTGEIGPMHLTNYAEVRPWAQAIKSAVLTRAMPPWFADNTVGQSFRNDRSLPDAEMRAIVSWVNDGCLKGSASTEAPLSGSKEFVESSAKPDAIIKVPAFSVPASGTLQYTFFVTNMNLSEDKWVRRAEWHIDQRQVVHHINAFVRPPGSSYVATAPYGVPYVASKAERLAQRPDETENDRRELLVGYEPGYRPEPWGKDRAKLIRKGSDMVFEMHYTTNGKAVTDSSELWIYFADRAPRERVLALQPSDRNLEIPPGDPNYRSFATAKFTSPVTLISLQPHMHLRGKAYQMDAVYPDGRREVLLRVPRYDFHWQTTYFLSRPMELPEGTVIECSAWYDNSPNNASNPDPAKLVRWGDQSWDEMNVGFLEVAFPASGSKEVAQLGANSRPPRPAN